VTNGIATVFSNPDQLCLDIPLSLPKLSAKTVYDPHHPKAWWSEILCDRVLAASGFRCPDKFISGFSELLVKFILQCSQIL
jgi:hypothetical protein